VIVKAGKSGKKSHLDTKKGARKKSKGEGGGVYTPGSGSRRIGFEETTQDICRKREKPTSPFNSPKKTAEVGLGRVVKLHEVAERKLQAKKKKKKIAQKRTASFQTQMEKEWEHVPSWGSGGG